MKSSMLLIVLFSGVIMASCSSSKKTTNAASNFDSLPALPLSEIDIPIKVYFPPLLVKAENMVPKEFTSEKWPDYTQSSCDFRYKYRFIRSPLQVTIANNQALINFGGQYQIAGSRSVCAFGKTIAPWISGSCGFGNEPLRRVQISMKTAIAILPQYRIQTSSKLAGIQAIDKCTVTLLNNDMTGEVMDSIKASIAAFTHVLDSSVNALDFSGLLQMVTQKTSRKIPLSKYGYLQVRPVNVRMSPVNLYKDTLVLSAGVSGYGELMSDSTDLPLIDNFPLLQQSATKSGISIYANSHYDYEFLSKLITDTVRDKVFDIEGRTFVIKKIGLSATEDRRLRISVDFAGNKKGTFVLFGTPVLDQSRQTIYMSNVDYDIQSKDVLLNVGEKLFRNKISNTLKEKAVFDLPALLEKIRDPINAQLNRSVASFLSSRGKLNGLTITGLVVGGQAIHLQTHLQADLELISSGF